MERILSNIVHEIEKEEERISLKGGSMIEEAREMALYLQELLASVKAQVLADGFATSWEEIKFFKKIKPFILGKLIYYNKVFRIETSCPVKNGRMYIAYYSKRFEELKDEYLSHICHSDFYRYYRSGRTDRDDMYFRLGNIQYLDGLSSVVFEIDPQFSTYYDYQVARIIANELLYTYLLSKINPDEPSANMLKEGAGKDIFWTGSKNALIELIYALHASGAVSYGKLGVRKLTVIFQVLFRVQLGDIHHAFYRMKSRAGSRTSFLDQLTATLNEYMDNEL